MRRPYLNSSILWPVFFMSGLILIVILPVLFLGPRAGDIEIENRDDWKVYVSEEFGFRFEYPPDWRVVDLSRGGVVPSFHVLPPGVKEEEGLVITPHTNKSNVSVYPEGYPIEGFTGRSIVSVVSFSEAVEESVDFYLSDDEDWATMIIPERDPQGWNEYGFLWSRASVDNYRVFCFDNKEEINRDLCEPSLGHEVVHEGSVDKKERVIQKEILESFSFIR